MNKTEVITLRVTLYQKKLLDAEAKRMGISVGWILRDSYFGEKSNTKYYIPEKPVELSKLKPPKGPPKVEKQITAIQPRGKINKRGFLTEIRDVFKKKGIFVN